MTVRLKLSEFEFLSFEIPGAINFGGKQMMAVHKLAGGERVINSMGKDDDDITFMARFYGENALNRARFLDGMRASGKEFIMTYSSFKLRVVIKYFKCVYKFESNLLYHIQMVVLEDLSQPVNVLPIGDYSDLINSELLQAYDLAFLIQNDPIDAAIAALNLATQNLNFSDGSVEAINIAIAAAETARGVVNVQNGMLVKSIFGIGGKLLLTATPPTTPTSGGLSNDVLADDLATSNNMYALSSILGVAIKNMMLITQGANGKVLTVFTANLYSLAAKYYGDVQKWTTIAEVNNLIDPEVQSDVPITLTVPLTAPTSNGILTV